MDDPRTRAGTLLGDYRLEQFLAESPVSITWLAVQASIGRPVLLVELKPAALERRESFLANIRAQAAVDHPLIGSVYEAVSTADQCFAALERLPGVSLSDRMKAREALKPVQVAHVLRRIAEAAIPLEAAGTATAPLGPADVFLDAHGVVRLANLAQAGPRGPKRSAEDIDTLGRMLPPLVADGRPGASRMLTVFAWMRGEGLDRTLSWSEIRSYAEQIEQQLAETPAAAAPQTARALPNKSPLPLVLGVAAVVAAIGIGAMMMSGKNGGKAALPLPGPVEVAAGEHPGPDGSRHTLPAFSLAGHEVTIGEYRDFLEALDRLPDDQQTTYDHSTQPAEKKGHEPEGWTELLAAAKSGSQWQGRAVGLDCPVVNVDWWDAAAYCEWKACRLPTEEEWFAGLRLKLDDPATLRAAGWGPVQEAPPTDRTPAGLHGMAGSVAEWTNSQSLNPANPLGGTNWVVIGGSFLKPGSGATTREWTANRGLRRPDLGFRVVLTP
jgi:formylglycine-generating enzyme required for sulfatase activity